MTRFRVIPENGTKGKVQTVTADTHLDAAAKVLSCPGSEVERTSGWSGGPGTFRFGENEVRVVRAKR
jgi:hypothetical protein